MERDHTKLEELQQRIDDAPGRAGFDSELARDIAKYAMQRRAEHPSWEELAKELRTATWLLKDCVRHDKSPKAKKRRKQSRKGKGKKVSVEVVFELPEGLRLSRVPVSRNGKSRREGHDTGTEARKQ